MATFEVLVYKVTIEPHPDADSIELAVIGDYRSVVKKGMYKTGDLAVYIPEAAILPEWVLKNQGFWDNNNQKGMLAGSAGNRVKAARFRGIISQGIVYPIINDKNGNYLNIKDNPNEESDFIEVTEGEDVTKYLGIVKYEPPIPTHLSGEVCNLMGYTLTYDIENYKKYPNIVKDGEEVIFSEKIHGTWCEIGWVPELDHLEIEDGKLIVSSKGLSSQGLAFKFNENNVNNVYVKVAKQIKHLVKQLSDEIQSPVYILGEIFGPIQDMRYGFCEPQFRVFDIYVGLPTQGRYQDKDFVIEWCEKLGIKTVPILYRGPFSVTKLREFTSGKETVSGHEVHLREGLVINVIPERYSPELNGRLVLKSVSDEYLLRKNKNATEFN